MEAAAPSKSRRAYTNATTQSLQLRCLPPSKEAGVVLMRVAATKEPGRPSRREIGAACFPIPSRKREMFLPTNRAE